MAEPLQQRTLWAMNSDPSSNAFLARRRWLVLALLLLITIINFIDRQTVSVLAPLIRASLHLSNTQYGRIVAAFQFGMMSGEFPMGWLMDRWGVRFGLLGAVLWWSAATGTQTLAKSGVQLGATRFWMGTGECGNYSGGLKAIFGAFAPAERTLAIGIFNSALRTAPPTTRASSPSPLSSASTRAVGPDMSQGALSSTRASLIFQLPEPACRSRYAQEHRSSSARRRKTAPVERN